MNESLEIFFLIWESNWNLFYTLSSRVTIIKDALIPFTGKPCKPYESLLVDQDA